MPSVVDCLHTQQLECIWVKVKIGNRKALVGSCYRKPSATVEYLEHIVDNLQKALSLNLFTILLGDFNWNYSDINCNNYARRIESICEMKQLITEPTRVTLHSSSLIDLLYTSDESFHAQSGVLHTTLRDHYGIYSVLSFKQPRLPLKIRYYNNMNVESFIDDICNHDIFNITLSDIVTVDDLVTNWNTWLSTLNEIVDKHALLHSCKNRSNPWFNNNIQQAIYHERPLKHNDINSWNKYRECRNCVTSLIHKYKCDDNSKQCEKV